MRAKHIIAALRIEAVGQQCCSRSINTVNHCRYTAAGCTDNYTGQTCVVIAADLTENVHRITLLRHIFGQTVDNNLTFNLHAFVIDTAATADSQLRVQSQKCAGNSRGRGGIADAHFACIKHIVALVDAHISHFNADSNRFFRLLARHRRSLGKIVRSPGYLFLINLGQIAQIKGSAYIADENIGVRMTSQHGSSGSTAHITVNHLTRNLLRISADAVFRNTVVTAHQNHRRL